MPKKVININDLSNGVNSEIDEKDSVKSVSNSENLLLTKGKIKPFKPLSLNVGMTSTAFELRGNGFFTFVTDYDLYGNTNRTEYVVLKVVDGCRIFDKSEPNGFIEITLYSDSLTFFYSKGFLRIVPSIYSDEEILLFGKIKNSHFQDVYQIDHDYVGIAESKAKNNIVSCISPRGIKSGLDNFEKASVIVHGIKFEAKNFGDKYSEYYILVDYYSTKPGTEDVTIDGKIIRVYTADPNFVYYSTKYDDDATGNSFIDWWNNIANVNTFVYDNFKVSPVTNSDLSSTNQNKLTDNQLGGIRAVSNASVIYYSEDTSGDLSKDSTGTFFDVDLMEELNIRSGEAIKFPKSYSKIYSNMEKSKNEMNKHFRFQSKIVDTVQGTESFLDDNLLLSISHDEYVSLETGIAGADKLTVGFVPLLNNVYSEADGLIIGGTIIASQVDFRFVDHNGTSTTFSINTASQEGYSLIYDKIFAAFNHADFDLYLTPSGNVGDIGIRANKYGSEYNGAYLECETNYSYIAPSYNPSSETDFSSGGLQDNEEVIDTFLIEGVEYDVTLNGGDLEETTNTKIFDIIDSNPDYVLNKPSSNSISSNDSDFRISIVSNNSGTDYLIENMGVKSNGNIYILPYSKNDESVVIDIDTKPTEDARWDEDIYSFGLSYVYLDGSESDISESIFKTKLQDDTELNIGLRLSNEFSSYHHLAKHIKVYIKGDGQDYWYYLGLFDFEKGFKPHSSETYQEIKKLSFRIEDEDTEITSLVDRKVMYTELVPVSHNPTRTFQYESGYKRSDITTATYKKGIVVNNRLFSFGIKQGDRINNDRILISPVNQLDILPESNYLDIVTEDGDEYVSATSFATEILAFKRETLYIIDVSSGTPSTFYMKGAFIGAGVGGENHITNTPYGVYWANENGIYFYNGKFPTNIVIGKVEEEYRYAYQISDSVSVGYDSKTEKVIVLFRVYLSIKSFVYDMRNKSFVFHRESIDDSVNISNFSRIENDLYIATSGTE